MTARQSAEVLRALGTASPEGLPEEAPTAPDPSVRPTERALRLGTLAVLGAALALLTGQAWLLAPAVVPLVLLVLSLPRRGEDLRRLRGEAEVPGRRVFEGEPVTARVDLSFAGVSGWIDPGVTPGQGLELTGVRVHGAVVELELTARRWGRWTLATVDVDVHDRGGLTRRAVRVDLGQVEVFPQAGSGTLTPIPVRLPDWIGEHTSRQSGEGLEIVGVRPYVHGERQRRIHWPATTRRGGAIQLNQFAAERAADVVVVLDAFADLRDPATGASSLDDSLRVAAGIVRAYLRSHDRVGVVSVGGKVYWLQPGTGEEYFYRLVQTVLDVRRDLNFNTPDLNRLPPPALPHGALVYAVTPLADSRMMDVLGGLAERGNPVVVVEIPIGDPRVSPDEPTEQLALRLWRLERGALRWSLVEKGIPVTPWEGGDSALDLAFGPLMRTRLQGRPR